MRYGLLFILCAIAMLFLPVELRGAGWLMLWPIIAFALVGVAYLTGSSRLFGKRPDGSLHPVSVIVLLPYLLYLWAFWHLVRFARRKLSPYDTLTPDLLIGRRLLDFEYPAQVQRVADLTCEFPEPRCIRRSKEYLSLPILDGGSTRVEDVLELAETIVAKPVCTYLHCAEGYGRTGMVACVVLLRQGVVGTSEEAIARVRAARPKVRLTAAQRRIVEQAAQALQAER